MNNTKDKPVKGKKKNVKEEEEPKVSFDGTADELLNILAPPIVKPKIKK